MRLLSALEVCQQAWASPASPSALRSSSSLASSSSSSSSSLPLSPRAGSPNTDSLVYSRRPSWLQGDSTERSGRGLVKVEAAFPKTPALVSSVFDLYEFICAGPLMHKLGYSPEKVAERIDEWVESGVYLCRLFKLNDLMLTVPQKARLYHYYIPVFLWCEDQVERHRATYKEGEEIPPLVIGVSAPQGSGKTTLVFALDFLFRRTGRNSATLSIDDFYLTADEQAKLRSQNRGNSLLEVLQNLQKPLSSKKVLAIMPTSFIISVFRGNAGSHDLQFSIETLTALSKLTKEGDKLKLPRYNKSAHGGRGDRADPSTWPEVEGPLEVVLFEGWMLGFKPLPDEVVKAVDPQLEVVNKNLNAYYDAWDKFIKSWIIIKIQDPNCVYQWRMEAEQAMRADGKPGMSDKEVLDFVSRYLPAYRAYLPMLYSEGPRGMDREHLLVVEVDNERNPIAGS